MKILLAPDKFKGSMTSFEACQALAAGIHSALPDARVLSFPMADGGDGFSRVMGHYLHTEPLQTPTVDALGKPCSGNWQWDPQSRTAIIELAAASGLALLQGKPLDPLAASSVGTGILIGAAIQKGAKKILLGLGGSASTDGGSGILAALGFQLCDREGREIVPCGGNLAQIEKIIPPAGLPRVYFEVAADVRNPLYGPDGAAFVYAPQKGADTLQVQELDRGLRHWSKLLESHSGKSPQQWPGSGAAGGIAAGLLTYFPGVIKSGVELVLQASGLEKELAGSDWILTGEGKLDDQSREGKLVSRLAELGTKARIPVVAFCGRVEMDQKAVWETGFATALSIADPGRSLADNMAAGRQLLAAAAESYFGNL